MTFGMKEDAERFMDANGLKRSSCSVNPTVSGYVIRRADNDVLHRAGTYSEVLFDRLGDFKEQLQYVFGRNVVVDGDQILSYNKDKVLAYVRKDRVFSPHDLWGDITDFVLFCIGKKDFDTRFQDVSEYCLKVYNKSLEHVRDDNHVCTISKGLRSNISIHYNGFTPTFVVNWEGGLNIAAHILYTQSLYFENPDTGLDTKALESVFGSVLRSQSVDDFLDISFIRSDYHVIYTDRKYLMKRVPPFSDLTVDITDVMSYIRECFAGAHSGRTSVHRIEDVVAVLRRYFPFETWSPFPRLGVVSGSGGSVVASNKGVWAMEGVGESEPTTINLSWFLCAGKET